MRGTLYYITHPQTRGFRWSAIGAMLFFLFPFAVGVALILVEQSPLNGVSLWIRDHNYRFTILTSLASGAFLSAVLLGYELLKTSLARQKEVERYLGLSLGDVAVNRRILNQTMMPEECGTVKHGSLESNSNQLLALMWWIDVVSLAVCDQGWRLFTSTVRTQGPTLDELAVYGDDWRSFMSGVKIQCHALDKSEIHHRLSEMEILMHLHFDAVRRIIIALRATGLRCRQHQNRTTFVLPANERTTLITLWEQARETANRLFSIASPEVKYLPRTNTNRPQGASLNGN